MMSHMQVSIRPVGLVKSWQFQHSFSKKQLHMVFQSVVFIIVALSVTHFYRPTLCRPTLLIGYSLFAINILLL